MTTIGQQSKGYQDQDADTWMTGWHCNVTHSWVDTATRQTIQSRRRCGCWPCTNPKSCRDDLATTALSDFQAVQACSARSVFVVWWKANRRARRRLAAWAKDPKHLVQWVAVPVDLGTNWYVDKARTSRGRDEISNRALLVFSDLPIGGRGAPLPVRVSMSEACRMFLEVCQDAAAAPGWSGGWGALRPSQQHAAPEYADREEFDGHDDVDLDPWDEVPEDTKVYVGPGWKKWQVDEAVEIAGPLGAGESKSAYGDRVVAVLVNLPSTPRTGGRRAEPTPTRDIDQKVTAQPQEMGCLPNTSPVVQQALSAVEEVVNPRALRHDDPRTAGVLPAVETSTARETEVEATT